MAHRPRVRRATFAGRYFDDCSGTKGSSGLIVITSDQDNTVVYGGTNTMRRHIYTNKALTPPPPQPLRTHTTMHTTLSHPVKRAHTGNDMLVWGYQNKWLIRIHTPHPSRSLLRTDMIKKEGPIIIKKKKKKLINLLNWIIISTLNGINTTLLVEITVQTQRRYRA